MKKPIGKNSHTSLLSEYKGNLFEFMVAHEISKTIKTEAQFLGKIAPNFHQLLRVYQQYIYEHDERLAQFLNHQAKPCADFILGLRGIKWSLVSVMGKVVANDRELSHEGDILLSHNCDDSHIHWPISLKIAKDKSYLNTKSAGIRSVFKKYFNSPQAQEKLNGIQDIEFIRLSQDLENLENLEPSDNFSSWSQSDLSTRPGELKGEARQILNAYYEKLLICLDEQLQDLRENDPRNFKQALVQLCGFQTSEITQIVAFHQEHKVDGAYFEAHHAQGLCDIETHLPEISRDSGVTSLYINGQGWRLQMRVKPMNAFTTKAIKINCSIRYINSDIR